VPPRRAFGRPRGRLRPRHALLGAAASPSRQPRPQASHAAPPHTCPPSVAALTCPQTPRPLGAELCQREGCAGLSPHPKPHNPRASSSSALGGPSGAAARGPCWAPSSRGSRWHGCCVGPIASRPRASAGAAPRPDARRRPPPSPSCPAHHPAGRPQATPSAPRAAGTAPTMWRRSTTGARGVQGPALSWHGHLRILCLDGAGPSWFGRGWAREGDGVGRRAACSWLGQSARALPQSPAGARPVPAAWRRHPVRACSFRPHTGATASASSTCRCAGVKGGEGREGREGRGGQGREGTGTASNSVRWPAPKATTLAPTFMCKHSRTRARRPAIPAAAAQAVIKAGDDYTHVFDCAGKRRK
jgi:hypothetical protein